MAIKIGHASIDENGKIAGGTAGDQTKKEVCVRTWYSKPWGVLLRCTDSKMAEKMAVACEKGCSNDKIGYDQYQRTTLYTQACKVNHDLSKITTACECDCSSFMCECAIAAGIDVQYNLTTSTMKNGFEKTGKFKVLTDSKYLTSDKYLKRGDILVKAGSHTVMVLEDGNGVSESKYTQKKFISDVCDILNVDTAKEAISKTVTISTDKNKNHKLVTPIQRYLKSLGYYNSTIEADLGRTPTFGPGCGTAVTLYQKNVLGYKNTDDEITSGGKMWKSLLGLV